MTTSSTPAVPEPDPHGRHLPQLTTLQEKSHTDLQGSFFLHVLDELYITHTTPT